MAVSAGIKLMGTILIDRLFVLSFVIVALVLTLCTENALAQSVQIITRHAGEPLSYTGYAAAGSTLTVTFSSSISVPVSGGDYNRQIGPVSIPSCNVVVTVSNVKTINFGGSMYVEVLGVGGWTPEVTRSVPLSTSNGGAYSYAASAGQYYARVSGKSDASSVNVDVSIPQQASAGSNGEYSVSISSTNLPSGIYTVTAGGAVVARIYLDTPAPQTYTLSLSKGWNIFSLPIVPDDSRIESIFTSDQLNNVNVIWDYNGGNWLYFTKKAGYTSQFSSLSVSKGYYIYCKTPLSVQVIGSPGPGVIPYSSLSKGWNLIGYPTTSGTDVSSVYGSAYVIWKIDNGNWYYHTTRAGLTNQFTTLTPGHGYWINKKT